MKKARVAYRHEYNGCEFEGKTRDRTFPISYGIYDDIGIRCAACGVLYDRVDVRIIKTKDQTRYARR